jgi:iron complex outermembrane receptor protein
VNGGDADVTGAELEVTLRVLDGLSVDASASYLNFDLKRINPGLAGVSSSTQQIFSPKRKASLGVQYRLPLGNLGTLTPRVDGQYQSSFFTNFDNNVLGQVPSYALVNARLAWDSASGDWSGALTVTNAADKFYYINKFRTGAPFNFVDGQPGAPREWAISLKRQF